MFINGIRYSDRWNVERSRQPLSMLQLSRLCLSMRRNVLGLERLIILAEGAIGVGLIAFSLSRNISLSVILLVLVGGSSILQITSSNTIIQTTVEDDKRGRVMSFYALAMVGMMPFGNLLAGSLAQLFGAPGALSICGSVCLLGSLWFSFQSVHVTNWIRQATGDNQQKVAKQTF